MKNVLKILTEKLLALSLFAMAQTVQTNMKIKINILGDIISPAAMVQLIEPRRQAWVLTVALILLLPIGALADNLITDASSPENLVAGGNNSVNYQVQKTGGTCVLTTFSTTTVNITTPAGITATPRTLVFNSCAVNKAVNFTATVSAVGLNSIKATASKAGSNTIGNSTATFNLNVTAAGDTTRPVITIVPPNPVSIVINTPYTDAGATASDNVDGNITSKIVTDLTNVNRLAVGTYKVTYDAKDNAGNSAIQAVRTVNVVAAPVTGNATVIIAFDDGWLDAFTNAFPVLDRYNQHAVSFVIEEPVVGEYPDYMSMSNLQSLSSAGWDISSHSLTHGSAYPIGTAQQNMIQAEYLVRANNTELKNELGDSKDWLDANGFTRSSMFFAYPFGTYDNVGCVTGTATGVAYSTSVCGINDLSTLIKNAGYYVGARSIDAYSWRHAGKHPKYKSGDFGANPYNPSITNDPMNVYRMATMTIDNTANSYPAAVENEINNTISENGLLILTFHHITTGNPTNAEEYSKANLSLISDFLYSQGTKVQVQTFSQYFNVPNPIPTYNPPTPLANTPVIGKDWIKVQWTDGAGNKTDVFDVLVNGNWTYNVATRYINVTNVLINTPVNVEVYAINRSWGWTNKNNISLITNAIIQTYIPPTPIDMTASESKNLSWAAGSGNVTNYYNVSINGVWSNGSTVSYYDATGLSPGTYTVSVYAVNSTNRITINTAPLILSATIIAPTYMPPTPIDMTAPGSKNLSWAAGSGNVTNYYNVNINGVWSNGSTVSYYNATGLSSGTYTVSVYAVNSTNRITINTAPLILSATIIVPTYMPPTPTISAVIGLDYINTTWAAGAGNNTDKFNILLNGTWMNGTTSTSVNVTGLVVGNYTDVSVFAVNGSIVNPTPATLNSTLSAPIVQPAPVHNGGGGGSGGSSGSSGGGGGFYDPNTYKFERQDTRIQKDILSTVQFKKNGLVGEVSFYGIKTYGDVTAVVSLLLNNPTTVPLDGVKTYFSVSLGTIKQAEEPLYINSGSITLTLDPSDIANKKVTFYRFVNGSWKLLESTELASSKDDHSVNFKLSMPGFSNFAVVIQDAISENVAPAEVKAAVKLAGDSNVGTNPNIQKSPGFEVAGIVLVLSILYIRRKL